MTISGGVGSGGMKPALIASLKRTRSQWLVKTATNNLERFKQGRCHPMFYTFHVRTTSHFYTE